MICAAVVLPMPGEPLSSTALRAISLSKSRLPLQHGGGGGGGLRVTSRLPLQHGRGSNANNFAIQTNSPLQLISTSGRRGGTRVAHRGGAACPVHLGDCSPHISFLPPPLPCLLQQDSTLWLVGGSIACPFWLRPPRRQPLSAELPFKPPAPSHPKPFPAPPPPSPHAVRQLHLPALQVHPLPVLEPMPQGGNRGLQAGVQAHTGTGMWRQARQGG